MLEDNWETIRDEGMAQLNDDSLFVREHENLRESGDWSLFVLFRRGETTYAIPTHLASTC